jgi:hypothetical protein
MTTVAGTVDERTASIASVIARLVEALQDGDVEFAIALATEGETQLAELLSRLEEQI